MVQVVDESLLENKRQIEVCAMATMLLQLQRGSGQAGNGLELNQDNLRKVIGQTGNTVDDYMPAMFVNALKKSGLSIDAIIKQYTDSLRPIQTEEEVE